MYKAAVCANYPHRPPVIVCVQRGPAHARALEAGRPTEHEPYVLTPMENVTFANGRAYIHITTDALLRQLGVLSQSAAADSTYKVRVSKHSWMFVDVCVGVHPCAWACVYVWMCAHVHVLVPHMCVVCMCHYL